MDNQTWLIKKKQYSELLNEDDIDIITNLFSDEILKRAKYILTNYKKQSMSLIIISMIMLISGVAYIVDPNLTDGENKLKAINDTKQFFGEELSNKLIELKEKYNIIF